LKGLLICLISVFAVLIVISNTQNKVIDVANNTEIVEKRDIYSLERHKQISEDMTKTANEIVSDIRDVSKKFDSMMDKSIGIREQLAESGQDVSGLIESEQKIQSHIDALKSNNEQTQDIINQK
jgi:hypothetical protein